jgi:hypothetical protein
MTPPQPATTTLAAWATSTSTRRTSRSSLTATTTGDGPDRAERRLELGAVLLLALTTLVTAWCGYQAARWSGEQSQNFARASATRIKSQQAATRAGQPRIDDLLYFNGWLDAREAGDAKLTAIYRARSRPEFEPAFRAWIAQHPFTNPRAIPGPLYMPEYRSAIWHAARPSMRRPTISTRRGRRASRTTIATSSPRSSSPPCCFSPASRCASTGGPCGSRCSACSGAREWYGAR